MTHTVNLSRARAFSRRNRAKKAMSILREKLEELEGEEVSISPEVNARIWEKGAEKPPARLEVDVVDTSSGLQAVLAGEEPEETEDTGEVEETEEPEETGETGEDYEEVVSGTVGEAKEAVQEMDDPDYEAILEAESDNKDRKTLKEWLESRIE